MLYVKHPKVFSDYIWESLDIQNIIKKDKLDDISKLKIDSKKSFLEKIFILKRKLLSTKKWKNYIVKIDDLVSQVSNKKLIKVYNKMKKINTNESEFKKHKLIFDYIKIKVGLEIHNREDINKEEI